MSISSDVYFCCLYNIFFSWHACGQMTVYVQLERLRVFKYSSVGDVRQEIVTQDSAEDDGEIQRGSTPWERNRSGDWRTSTLTVRHFCRRSERENMGMMGHFDSRRGNDGTFWQCHGNVRTFWQLLWECQDILTAVVGMIGHFDSCCANFGTFWQLWWKCPDIFTAIVGMSGHFDSCCTNFGTFWQL